MLGHDRVSRGQERRSSLDHSFIELFRGSDRRSMSRLSRLDCRIKCSRRGRRLEPVWKILDNGTTPPAQGTPSSIWTEKLLGVKSPSRNFNSVHRADHFGKPLATFCHDNKFVCSSTSNHSSSLLPQIEATPTKHCHTKLIEDLFPSIPETNHHA